MTSKTFSVGVINSFINSFINNNFNLELIKLVDFLGFETNDRGIPVGLMIEEQVENFKWKEMEVDKSLLDSFNFNTYCPVDNSGKVWVEKKRTLDDNKEFSETKETVHLAERYSSEVTLKLEKVTQHNENEEYGTTSYEYYVQYRKFVTYSTQPGEILTFFVWSNLINQISSSQRHKRYSSEHNWWRKR